jgi:predicted nucleotide-binding protein
MNSAVDDLQKAIVRGEQSLVQLLRHTKIVAANLELKDVETWVDLEMSGYPIGTELPDYRVIVASQLEYHNPYQGGWQFVGNVKARIPIRQPIAEIEHLSHGDVLTAPVERNYPIQDTAGIGMLSKLPQRLSFDGTQLKKIIAAVTDELLRKTTQMGKEAVKKGQSSRDALSQNPDETGKKSTEIMAFESPDQKLSKNPRCVFVVHGRNLVLRDSMFAFLRAIALQPLEWSQAVKATGEASPYIGHVLDTAFSMAQAIVVLMTPDDDARLRTEFHSAHDEQYEKQLTPQARPNVLFEAGMAMGRDSKRTVLVQVGQLRPFSDIGGRHVLRLKNSSTSRQELADRLRTAGCDVDMSGTDWHTTGSFDAIVQSVKRTEDGAQPENNKQFIQWKDRLLPIIAGLKIKMMRLRSSEWYPEFETSIVEIAELVAVIPGCLSSEKKSEIVEFVGKTTRMTDSQIVHGKGDVFAGLERIESLLKGSD